MNNEKEEPNIIPSKLELISVPYMGVVNENEKPMTPEEMFHHYFNKPIETDEDYQTLGYVFDEDE